MDRSKLCGCKGVRTCFVCEKEFNLTPTINSDSLKVSYYTYLYLLFYLLHSLIFRNYQMHHIVLTAIYYGVAGMHMNIKTIQIILVHHTI